MDKTAYVFDWILCCSQKIVVIQVNVKYKLNWVIEKNTCAGICYWINHLKFKKKTEFKANFKETFPASDHVDLYL